MSEKTSPYKSQEKPRGAKKIGKRLAGLALAATVAAGAGSAIKSEMQSDQYEPWHVGGNMPSGLEEGEEVTYIPGEHGGVINPIVRIGEDGKPTLVGFDANQGAEDNEGEQYLFDIKGVEDVDLTSAENATVKREEVVLVSDIGKFPLQGVDASTENGDRLIVGLPSESYRAEQIVDSTNG